MKMTSPATIEEKTCKKNDLKARSLLLIALPNEHQLNFDQYVDAQSMFAAIKARFGGNEATKKTRKALLKQQYENFSASNSESLDSIFNRLQKLVSRLEILSVATPSEDLNVKILRSLPSEWDTHVVVWMNKPDFDTMGLDDLYNNFKIVEQKVKKSAGASNDDKNLAFVSTSGASSTNNTNTVNLEVSTATTKVNTARSQLVHEDLEQLHDDDLEEMYLKWNMALLSMGARKFYQRTGRKIIIDGSNTAGYYSTTIKWDILPGNAEHLGVKTTEIGIKSKRFRQTWLSWHSQILSDTGFKAATYKRGLTTLEDQIVKYKEHEVHFSEEIALLKRSIDSKEYQLGLLKTELEKTDSKTSSFKSPLKVDKDWKEKFFYPANHVESVNKIEKPVKRTVKYAEMYRSQKPRGNQRNWNNLKSQQLGNEFVMNNKACFACGSFNHLIKDCKRKVQKPIWNNARRVNHHNSHRMSYPHPKRNFVPKAVLMKTGMRPVNAAKPKAAYNAVKRNRFNAVKASACWVWMPKNRVVDHVSKNISASVTLKRLDYIDAQGRFKSVMAWMDAQAQGRQECSKEKEESREECSKSRKTKKMKCLEESSQQRK
ncbi:putative ribonuclease H-like domain-containing protein [Tanacetum coccineum]